MRIMIKRKQKQDWFLAMSYVEYFIPSAKPRDSLTLLAKKFKKKEDETNLELLSRNNNVVSGWVHIGQELSNTIEVIGVFVPKEKIPSEYRTDNTKVF